jgi:hypothetical protein
VAEDEADRLNALERAVQGIRDTLDRALSGGRAAESSARDSAGGRTESRLDREAGIPEQIQRAIAEAHAKDEDKRRVSDLESQVADVKARAEKQPVERRPVHHFMGWGE